MSTNRRGHVGIVGGGMLGATLAYRLARRGLRVTLLESQDAAGGLAGTVRLGPYEVDRFYHVISPSDDRMLSTIAELGLTDRLSFAETRVGVYMDGVVRPFDGIADLLRFSPLTPVQRARLGWFLTRCKVAGDPETLDGIPLEQWVRTHCGDRIWDRFWLPLFNSRFENDLDGLPATYLWARSRRMANARTGPRQGERFAMLRGGHQALIDALIAATRELGSDVVTSCPAEGLVVGTDGGVDGVDARGEAWHFDLTVSTLPPPALQRLLPVESLPGLAGMPSRILGVVCLVATLRDSISPFYSVNICAPSSITTVVEASHVVGTDHTGGLRLLYVPRYCRPDAPEQSESDQSILERFAAQVAEMFPKFSQELIVDWHVERAPYVEPVHGLDAGRRLPPVWGLLPRLAIASNAQIYPWQLNGEASMRMAEHVEQSILERV